MTAAVLAPGHPPDRRPSEPRTIAVKGARRASRVTAPQAPPLTAILLGSRLERQEDGLPHAGALGGRNGGRPGTGSAGQRSGGSPPCAAGAKAELPARLLRVSCGRLRPRRANRLSLRLPGTRYPAMDPAPDAARRAPRAFKDVRESSYRFRGPSTPAVDRYVPGLGLIAAGSGRCGRGIGGAAASVTSASGPRRRTPGR